MENVYMPIIGTEYKIRVEQNGDRYFCKGINETKLIEGEFGIGDEVLCIDDANIRDNLLIAGHLYRIYGEHLFGGDGYLRMVNVDIVKGFWASADRFALCNPGRKEYNFNNAE